jgi:hypothetical protein
LWWKKIVQEMPFIVVDFRKKLFIGQQVRCLICMCSELQVTGIV